MVTQVAHAPFVGRADELQVADAARGSAVAGTGVLLLVSGDAGIGKTRLCEEVTARARAEGMPVAWGRCWADGGAPPLWPWHGVLTELCGPDAAAVLGDDPGSDDVDPDRFARFAAVVDALRQACRERPSVIVIDDLHDADAGAVLLTRFVARSLATLPVLLVVTRRDGEPAGSSTVAGLLGDLAREGRRMPLHGLDEEASAALLASLGVSPDSLHDVLPPVGLPRGRGTAEGSVILRLTGGNPLFLHELAAAGGSGPASGMPAGTRHAIDERLDRLDAAPRGVLAHAALLGMEASLRDTAAVAGVDLAAAAAAMQAGVAAGVVDAEGVDRFAFAHVLLREGLLASLDPAAQLDAHARAAAALRGSRGIDAIGRRARHASLAALRSRDDARIAVEANRDAARAMVHGYSYEEGARLLAGAASIADAAALDDPRADLLVEHAETVLLCGRLSEARGLFDAAASRALDEHDAESLARAAIGLGGVWVNERRSPDEQARVHALQERALRELPAHADVLRARLTARLAAEARYRWGPLEPVAAAVDVARATGDGHALAEALSLWHHCLLAPEHASLRLPVAEELITVASAAGSGMLVQMGLCWRTVDLFLSGDRRAARALEDFRLRADALQNQSMLYIVAVMDVMLLVRAGRFDEAEAAAARCLEHGQAVGDADALACYGAHLVAIRWAQGRSAEVLPFVADLVASPTLPVGDEVFPAGLAALAAGAGDLPWARAAVDRLLSAGLAAIVPSSTWLTSLFAVVEAAHALGDAAIAAEAYDALLPFAALPVMPSLAVVCLGSVERLLGLAAATCGRLDDAIAHLERAVAANARLRNRPLVAITRGDLAAALARRDAPGDRAMAAGALDAAIRAGDEMQLDARVAAWREERAVLTVPTAAPGTVAPGTVAPGTVAPSGEGPAHQTEGPEPQAPVGTFRQVGSHWVVASGGREVLVADSVGMSYLRRLLAQPGVPFSAGDLAGGGDEVIVLSDQPLLDDRARESYRQRVVELQDDLTEAEHFADIERVARLRAELDEVLDELSRAAGLGGRARSFAAPSERARTSVRKAIKRALDRVVDADPALGVLLASSVTTGSTCRYAPVPGAPTRWITE